METKELKKSEYVSPTTQVVELRTEGGLLTGSTNDAFGIGNPFGGSNENDW